MKRLFTILLKITLTIIGIALFLCASVAVIFNFVLTPKHMTPVIESLIQEQLNSEIEIASVDFSLFSTLPKVSVVVDSLRIKQLAPNQADLFSVDRCLITLTPQSILKRKVVINEILFKKPSVNFYVDSIYRPMAHFKIDTLSSTPTDTTTQFNLGDYKFRLDSIRIDSAHFVVNDRRNGFYSSIESMSTGVKLKIGPKRVVVTSDIDFTGFDAKLNDERYSSNTSMGISSTLIYKIDSSLLNIKNATLNVNGIKMKASGTLIDDTANKCAYIDIDSSLETPSLMEFIDLIPSHMLSQKDSLSTQGAVDLSLKIKGTYSETVLPEITGNIKIDNAKVRYGTNPISLDKVDCDADMLIDLNTPKRSYAKINNLFVNTSGIINMSVKGDVTEIATSPLLNIDFDSNIDFDRIHEIIPLPNGVTLSGRNINDLHTKFRLEDVEQSNYGKLYIDGESKFENVNVEIDGSKFLADSTLNSFFAVNIERGNILFGDKVRENNSRTLLSTVNFSGFGFKDRNGLYSTVKSMQMTMGANFDRITQTVNGVGVNIQTQSINAGIESEIDVQAEKTNMTLTISPKNEKHNTKMLAKISSQSIAVNETEFNSTLLTQMANAELNMTKESQKQWYLSGWTGFDSLELYSDLFPLKTSLVDSRLTINGNRIELEGANVDMGESHFVATGYTTNIIKSMFFDPTAHIDGKLSIKSPILNVNELMEATNKSVIMNETGDISEADMPSDTTSMMLLVPRNTTFEFDMDVDQVKYGESSIDNLLGLVSVKDGLLSLDKLTFSAIGAKTLSSIKYYNIDKNNSNIYMNINLRGANIERIGELLPSVTQMMPMMEALKGNVDFYMQVKTNVDKDMNIDFETLRANSSLSGRRLVLMDQATFEDLAKTLMFKNKDRNLINSLKVYMTADKNKFTVLPFELEIDRYNMIIGGEQFVSPETYDLDYTYNISVIKSPLPFKAGVDINGRNEEFDFKVTKAKLKNSDFNAIKQQYYDFRDTITE